MMEREGYDEKDFERGATVWLGIEG